MITPEELNVIYVTKDKELGEKALVEASKGHKLNIAQGKKYLKNTV